MVTTTQGTARSNGAEDPPFDDVVNDDDYEEL